MKSLIVVACEEGRGGVRGGFIESNNYIDASMYGENEDRILMRAGPREPKKKSPLDGIMSR